MNRNYSDFGAHNCTDSLFLVVLAPPVDTVIATYRCKCRHRLVRLPPPAGAVDCTADLRTRESRSDISIRYGFFSKENFSNRIRNPQILNPRAPSASISAINCWRCFPTKSAIYPITPDGSNIFARQFSTPVTDRATPGSTSKTFGPSANSGDFMAPSRSGSKFPTAGRAIATDSRQNSQKSRRFASPTA